AHRSRRGCRAVDHLHGWGAEDIPCVRMEESHADPQLNPQEQRRYYETLIHASPTAIVTLDLDFVVASWNPAAERLFGYTADEAIGAQIDDLVGNRPEVHDEALAWSREAWQTGGTFRRIGQRTRKDGSLVDVEILAAQVMHDDQAIGYYILYHDVTELE